MEATPIDEDRFHKFVEAVYNSTFCAGMKEMGWPEEKIRETISGSLRGWLNYSVRPENKEHAVLEWAWPPRGSKTEKIAY